MQTVNLVCLTPDNHRLDWPPGRAWSVRPVLPDILQFMYDALPSHPAHAWLFWDPLLGPPSQALLDQLLSQPVDLWHAGLLLGARGKPELLDFVSPTRMFSCDPLPSLQATSWRISMSACLVRTEVLLQNGFLRPEFSTLQGAALEWGYRCLQYGVLMRHLPTLLTQLPAVEAFNDSLPLEDEMRFVYYRFGRKWSAWAGLRAAASGYASILSTYHAYRKVAADPAPPQPSPFQSSVGQPTGSWEQTQKSPAVSVLVPTLDRYPYLHTLLQQLEKQTVSPQEILVIDQTPSASRLPNFYEEFTTLPLSVTFLDQFCHGWSGHIQLPCYGF